MTIDDAILEANNLVIDTDYYAAMEGIEKRFLQLKEELRDDVGTTQLLDQVEASLKRNISRVVNPVSRSQMDERTKMLENLMNDVEETVDAELEDEMSLLDEETDDDDEEAFDEEALKDEEAYERVRDLRKQVREASERLFKITEGVRQKAADLAQKEIILQRECNDAASEHQTENEDEVDEHSLDEKENNIIVSVENLRHLTEKLDDVTLKMPEAISRLEETIENVEKDIYRKPESLSQTEVAILSQNNEGFEERNIAIISDAEEKFACFVELNT
mmetsp:Transcript_11210/g.17332  ORF Transcript_11210/g.17332 Transcript_11210/m.17332 type:complete len:276 (+) Transcript_11210:63-890(+)|eukprot:CAMPEP_0178924796 /NCGR_PEP_ID=MMETSP0786-20121207/17527_1 /TAXON_ID=186022 /ORGANISM="Thalassionema frauenfeldii, Strain CCMP 1798" /LENGTH=275 /DNA_ID=CAMNT_0020599549 /DNA_START=56 /DNA_END=883 /DNA_ORIENTATION=-